MLTSISPLGERARGNRYRTTATAYVVASVLGGAVTGVVLGAVGRLTVAHLPAAARVVLAVVACLVAVLSDAARGPRLPGGHRQVDEDWLTRYRGWVYGAGFGFQLGLGVVTIVTSAATWAVLALVLLGGTPTGGVLVGVVFGLVRALPVLAVRRADTPVRLRTAAARLEQLGLGAARATAGALAVAAAALLGGGVALGWT